VVILESDTQLPAVLAKVRGYEVTISGRSAERVAEAAEQLGVTGFVADMSSLADIQSLAALFTENGLDGLVNNAAIARFMLIIAHTELDYEEFLNTNICGPLALIQSLVPALAKKKGCVTNVSSVDSFTRSLALELAPQGIRVNAVSPGAIDTPILAKLGLPAEQIEAIKTQQEAMIPLQRYGKPEEVAHVILGQIEASYVTGSIWSVDGGVDAV